MSNPKPFYELPKPPRKRYGVIVVEIENENACMQLQDVFGACDQASAGLCLYCGLPTCDDDIAHHHKINEDVLIEIMCSACATLPPDVREAVRAFREQVNRS